MVANITHTGSDDADDCLTVDLFGRLTVGDLSLIGSAMTNGSLTSSDVNVEAGTLQVNGYNGGTITVANGCTLFLERLIRRP
jgi:hypothetical protein